MQPALIPVAGLLRFDSRGHILVPGLNRVICSDCNKPLTSSKWDRSKSHLTLNAPSFVISVVSVCQIIIHLALDDSQQVTLLRSGVGFKPNIPVTAIMLRLNMQNMSQVICVL